MQITGRDSYYTHVTRDPTSKPDWVIEASYSCRQFKQITHISPGEEYRRPAYLEEVLAIFKRNSHPFVQVDSLAMRWMGSSNIPTLVSET